MGKIFPGRRNRPRGLILIVDDGGRYVILRLGRILLMYATVALTNLLSAEIKAARYFN